MRNKLLRMCLPLLLGLGWVSNVHAQYGSLNGSMKVNYPSSDIQVGGLHYSIIDNRNRKVAVICTSKTTLGVPNGEYSGEIEIPSTIKLGNGLVYTVAEIYDHAFRNCKNLTRVTLNPTLERIGAYAFDNCSGLTEVVLPDNLESIDSCAFQKCTRLNTINIPNNISVIRNHLFDGCSSLKSLSIPNNVTRIERGAMYGCSSLASVNIPRKVTYVGEGAFRGCSKLTSITIPQSITELRKITFAGCSALSKVVPCTIVQNIRFYFTSLLDDIL